MNSRELAQRITLDPHLAIYHAAHDCRLGIKGLAAMYGLNATILSNKLNPNCPGNHLDLRTALMVWEATQDPRIPESFAAAFGGHFTPQLDAEHDGASVVTAIASLSTSMSTMVADVASAMSDGHVSAAERQMIATDARRLIQEANRLAAIVNSFSKAGEGR